MSPTETLKLFGTDGIRAPFGQPPLDRSTVEGLGKVLAETLVERHARPGEVAERSGAALPIAPEVVIGGDTRESTPTLARWMAEGLLAGGAAPRFVGMVPTPAVAYLVTSLGAQAGVVISASHNPYPDNGVKLFDESGFKWSPEAERRLEQRLRSLRPTEKPGESEDAQPLKPEGGLVERYLDRLASSLIADPAIADPATGPLAGLSIVCDAGNGAASPYAGPLFERLGARVEVLHAEPDGRNVNLGCGSTDTRDLRRHVVEGRYDLGIAFDGDADRAILVDERGVERDGDSLLYLWACELQAHDLLSPAAIVATSMSNLGLERALDARGIGVTRCDVGDRAVVETLRRDGLLLGGEQSGHIVHLDLSSTGDGLLTAVQIAGIVARHRARSGCTLSELLREFVRYPQVLTGIRVASKPPLDSLPRITEAAGKVERQLAGDGRLVLRYSGTEPLARIMIEGPDQQIIESLAEELGSVIRAELGT